MAPDNVESPVRYPSDLSNEEWEILQTISTNSNLIQLDAQKPIFAKF